MKIKIYHTFLVAIAVLLSSNVSAVNVDSLLSAKEVQAPVYKWIETNDTTIKIVPYLNENEFSETFFIQKIDSNIYHAINADSSIQWNYLSTFYDKDGDIKFLSASLLSKMVQFYFPVMRVEWVHIVSDDSYKGLFLRVWMDDFDTRNFDVENIQFSEISENHKLFWSTFYEWFDPIYTTQNWLRFTNDNGKIQVLPDLPFFMTGGSFYNRDKVINNIDIRGFVKSIKSDTSISKTYDQNKMVWCQTMMYHRSLTIWSDEITDFLNAEGKIHSKIWKMSYSKFRRRIENHKEHINDLSLDIKEELKQKYGEPVEVVNPRVESYKGLFTMNQVPLDSMRRPIEMIKGVKVELSTLPSQNWSFDYWYDKEQGDTIKKPVLDILPNQLMLLPFPEFAPLNVHSYRRIVNVEHDNYFLSMYRESFIIVMIVLVFFTALLSWVIFNSK